MHWLCFAHHVWVLKELDGVGCIYSVRVRFMTACTV